MPKLWSDTIEAHRHQVEEAILTATAKLVMSRGLSAVTMSEVAEASGIGRATLYKYFADVEAILHAWHARQVAAHLRQLVEVRDRTEGPVARLEAVLEAFAAISHERHEGELAAMLHRGDHMAHAHGQLLDLVRELVEAGAKAGELRDDIAPRELASFCLHALTAASSMPSKAAARRLVRVTLDGLRPD